jgi:drug/metabolite transporter (DMT)-like permease
MMSSIDIRAILLATLAVFGIDYISRIVLVAVFGDPIVDGSDEELKAAAAALLRNTGFLRGALVLGTASTVVGGFLVARIARSIPYFNALAYGLLGVLLSLLWTGESPTWFRVLGIGLTVPAALLGAYFGKRLIEK